MLAQLLRRLLYIQWATGALLAGVLVLTTDLPLLWACIFPFALQLVLAILTTCWTCWISRAPEPWGPWWRSLLGENLAGLLTFVLRQPWSRAAPALLSATGESKRIPVVLVHGFVCNHRIWDSMVPQLRSQGHAVLAIDLEPLFGSIDDYAPLIDAAVQKLCAHSGTSQVALVGHSMGGLAIRAWMRRYGAGKVARVITLGTPHQGTRSRAPFPAVNASEMAWHSAWLADLAASEDADTRARLCIALTPQDNIVFPQRAQTLEGIQPTVFEGIGHLQMCTDAHVRAWVCKELLACAQP